jgi:glycosyltransferase involved in cell wall biosynthesis
VVVPSKLYGILVAARPIVAVTPAETDVASLGVRQGFAVCCNPDSPEEMVAAVRVLVADASQVRAMGDAARAAAQDYDRVREGAKFEQIVGSVARWADI